MKDKKKNKGEGRKDKERPARQDFCFFCFFDNPDFFIFSCVQVVSLCHSPIGIVVVETKRKRKEANQRFTTMHRHLARWWTCLVVSGFMALYCASGCMLHELPVGFIYIPARCRSLTNGEDEAGTALSELFFAAKPGSLLS